MVRGHLRIHRDRESASCEASSSGIYEHAQVLETDPEIGYRYLTSNRHVRILLYGHYRIAYLVKENGNVDILGVFHGHLYQTPGAGDCDQLPVNTFRISITLQSGRARIP